MASPVFFQNTDEGLSFWVRAKPGQAKESAIRAIQLPDGKGALEVSVAARAVEGQANEALIARLAKEMGVKRGDIRIQTGETGRLKRIVVRENAAAKAEAWVQVVISMGFISGGG